MVSHARERPKLTAKGERAQSLDCGVVAVDQQRGRPDNRADL
jgi:hypothetical protein